MSPEPDRELRFAVAPITNIEVRDPSGTHDNTWTMSGYAAVFDDPTVLYNSKYVRLTESIAPKAFDRVLREQGTGTAGGAVHFNFGHDMNRAVAATDVPAGEPGSLKLSADSRGLYFEAKVPRDDPDGIALASKMRTGVVRQASFAFTIGEADYQVTESEDGPDTEHRTIQELSHLYDVCACAQGAYSSTESQVRSYAEPRGFAGQPEEGGQRRQPDTGGASDISPEEGVVETPPPLEWPDLSQDLVRHRPIAVDQT
jgi:HK97 family phage prohead protease